MRVVTLPGSVEERTFEAIVRDAAVEPEARLLLDARHVRWVDPYGMIGLLTLGTVAERRGERPALRLPESHEVLSYLDRMRFFEHAEPLFELHGAAGRPRAEQGHSDVLLEVTPVRSHDDVHQVVDRVNERGLTILTRQLQYPAREAFQFSVILSEVCQNIIEHSEAQGWVATQTYTWTKRLGRKVVVIAVMDLGIGFRRSLSGATAAHDAGAAWDDAAALEAAFMHARSRFQDPGRGQGIQQIRRQVGRWGGRVSIRSGTAKVADVPAWDDAQRQERTLPFLPGAQIGIVLPARVPLDETPAAPTAQESRSPASGHGRSPAEAAS